MWASMTTTAFSSGVADPEDESLLVPSPRLPAAPRRIVWEGKAVPQARDDSSLRHGVKRAIDVAVAGLGLVLLAPILAGIGVAIRVTSPGPALFVQKRWGARRCRVADGGWRWEAREFRCCKFRTMTHRADDGAHVKHVAAFVSGNLDGTGPAGFKLRDDPRVTRIGSLLRRTSLDELPQLLNVLRGEMSLVGPRPVPAYEVESYPGEWCLERLAALPGVTGPWQVHGRSRVSFEEMMRMDLDYVRRPSITRDLGLIAMTVPSVLARRGAQ
jgi:lipopolysaccharide/colanic/teichoic acid biosynthesis glycosyltransferase